MVAFAERDHSKADMVIVAILSHGDEDKIEGTDGKSKSETGGTQLLFKRLLFKRP
jgi:hypothetical protein